MQKLVRMGVARSAADVIDSTDDLLIQILICLPVKSLMRFKLVSKHWKSLITSHRFFILRSPNPVAGLFIHGHKSAYNYIHLDVTSPKTEPPFRELIFPGDPFPYGIKQSCNGLLLCCRSDGSEARSCCVYNPTTKCFAKIPRPGVTDGVQRTVRSLHLAFDPAKSPVYKAVCVRGSVFSCKPFQIEMYSSESGAWRVSGEPFCAEAWFDHGVYWNGSIHWIHYRHKVLLYFNVNKEKIAKMSLPTSMTRIAYFGESCDHLHVIGICDVQMAFDVYEMRRDYSEWFVVYRVDMTMAAAYFPETTHYHTLIDSAACYYGTRDESELKNRIRYRYSVLSLIRAEEKRSFLILHASDKAIRCNLHYNTFEEIPNIGDAMVESWLQYVFESCGFADIALPHAFEIVESLAGV